MRPTSWVFRWVWKEEWAEGKEQRAGTPRLRRYCLRYCGGEQHPLKSAPWLSSVQSRRLTGATPGPLAGLTVGRKSPPVTLSMTVILGLVLLSVTKYCNAHSEV